MLNSELRREQQKEKRRERILIKTAAQLHSCTAA